MKDIIKLILVGGSGTCRDVIELIKSINKKLFRYKILGILDDSIPLGKLNNGVKVLGPISDYSKLRDVRFVDCLGSSKNYNKRKKIIEKNGFVYSQFETLIHHSSFIGDQVKIRQGSIIFPNVVVLSKVCIGHHVTILSGTVINHDVEIGDWSIIGSGCMLSGGVKIGKSCYLGSSSSIREKVEIGNGSLVGMGAAVINNVAKCTEVVGVPAKFLRNVK